MDLTLHPLDTLKTRLQSAPGFRASGGFTGIYAGVGSALVGSAPGAALFFVTYESTKSLLRSRRSASQTTAGAWTEPLEHMAAASAGEVAACMVRVPTEVVKQRAQAGQYASSLGAVRGILAQRARVGLRGVGRELYRGWGVTVLREVPFTVIQFPVWEGLKGWWQGRRGRERVGAVESAAFGSVAGGVAAGVTTPLDVVKTRLMLGREREGVGVLVGRMVREEGAGAFFRGVGPRVVWISVGGAVFLGSYQWAFNALSGVP